MGAYENALRYSRDEAIELAKRLKAPVGYAFRGKQWLEHDSPNAVGMTGLIGYGGAYGAIHEAELLLLLGTRQIKMSIVITLE